MFRLSATYRGEARVPHSKGKEQSMRYVQLFFNFRAKAVEFRFYQFRFGGVIEGIEGQNLPYRVFPQGVGTDRRWAQYVQNVSS
jgi:hypothetical protein